MENKKIVITTVSSETITVKRTKAILKDVKTPVEDDVKTSQVKVIEQDLASAIAKMELGPCDEGASDPKQMNPGEPEPAADDHGN
ncbi:MAG TPA: hypothetical protein PKD24_07895 [Pyrinomonadaceae bacterium]|nr:hypothetical protein [Pyrinomonadaceae bacterium]